MFKENGKTGLPKKMTQKETMLIQGKSDSPAKRKTKETGKRTGGRPTRKLQTSGMSLQAEIPVGISQSNNSIPQIATPNTDKHFPIAKAAKQETNPSNECTGAIEEVNKKPPIGALTCFWKPGAY